MLSLSKGLNPLSTQTHCFFKTKGEKKDIFLYQFIQNAWNNNLNYEDSIKATFLALIGNHQSFAVTDDDYLNESNINSATFKGVLDFLVLPLIARRIWNWSFLQKLDLDNNFCLELGIFAARAIAIYISSARVAVGIALTIALAPIVGLVCLIRAIPLEQSTVEDKSNEEEFFPVPPFINS